MLIRGLISLLLYLLLHKYIYKKYKNRLSLTFSRKYTVIIGTDEYYIILTFLASHPSLTDR